MYILMRISLLQRLQRVLQNDTSFSRTTIWEVNGEQNSNSDYVMNQPPFTEMVCPVM